MKKSILCAKVKLIWLASILFFNMLFLLISPLQASPEKPVILSTIQPIHLLVKEILGDVGRAELLIPAYTDIHHYHLYPSVIRKIAEANLVVQVSSQFEFFLNELLIKKPRLEWLQLAGINPLPLHHDHHEHDHHEETVAQDPHLWLDPDNAQILVTKIQAWLIQYYPTLATVINKNSENLKSRIAKVNHATQALLQSNKARKYMVLHDATQYFQYHYQLLEPYVLSFNEGLQPGIKSYLQARKTIKAGGFSCIVVDKNKINRALKNIMSDLNPRFVAIDFNGAQAESYPEFLQRLGDKMATCLSPNK